jgi:YD repeat-containing protein
VAEIPSPSGRGTRAEAEYDGSGNLIFWGTAAVTVTTDMPNWKIAKLTYDGSGNLLTMKWANGAKFASVWDDRAGLTYL